MTSQWPPLDTHAHVDATIPARELLALRSVVLAVTRSLSESKTALGRAPHDELAVWGVGTHPASASALNEFDPRAFAALATRAAFVGEVGLDGVSKSTQQRQYVVFGDVLATLQGMPRLTSIHSYRATDEVVAALQRRPIDGAILHWWLGSAEATATALDLGAYFSVNHSNAGHIVSLGIPVSRLFVETDHPDGDRRAPAPRRPGRVESAEQVLASGLGVTPDELRLATWRNLRVLAGRTGTLALLPARIRSMLDALPD